MCPTTQADYGQLELVLQLMEPLKSLTVNAFDRCSEDDTNGFARSDVFLSGLQLPCSATSLFEHIDSRGLWSLMSAPEGLHLVLNHSVALRNLLESQLPDSEFSALSKALLEATGFPLDTKLRAGWQWRMLWSTGDVFATHLHGHTKLLQLVQTFANIIVALYAPSSFRNAKTLLRIAVQCFVHASIWRDMGAVQQLASHFIWPHVMFAFRDLPPSWLLSESTERVFTLFRRIDNMCSFHGSDYISGLLQRYLAYMAVRQAERGLRQSPAIEYADDPCDGCEAGRHARTVVDPAIVGDTRPLFLALDALGFDRAVVTKQHDDGKVEILDAHADLVPNAPVLPSLSQLAAERELQERRRVVDLFGEPVPEGERKAAEAVPAEAAPAEAVPADAVPAEAAPEGASSAKRKGKRKGPASSAVASVEPVRAKLRSASKPAARKAHEHKGRAEADAGHGLEDDRAGDVPLGADEYLTDEEFAAVFGTEERQREEEEQERAQAEADAKHEPEWTPRSRHTVCSNCGRNKRKHQHKADEGKSASSKMSLDDE